MAMFDRWTTPSLSSGHLLIIKSSAASGAERRQALSRTQAVWEVAEKLRDRDSRHRLCEMYAECMGGSVDFTRRSTQELAREITGRIESGSLLVIPVVEKAVIVLAGSAAPKKTAPPPPAPVEDEVTVAIKAGDGVSDPPVSVAVSCKTKLKGEPSRGAGSYKWSTTSARITLEGDTAQAVVIAAGTDPSPAALAETIELVFTPTGKAALAPVSHKLGLAAASFSADPGHSWGYDTYEKMKCKDKDDNETEPTPDPAKDFVSVKVGEVGKVKLELGGVEPDQVFLESSNAAKCKPKVQHPAAASSTLQIEGVAAGEADIEAHLESPTGPLVGRVGVHVLEEKTFKAEIFCVADSTSASTALALTPAAADVQAALDTYYKQAVGKWDVRGGGATVNVAYDLNGNGKLDMEPGVTTPEQLAIIAACRAGTGFTPVIIVKDLRWCYYLDRDAAATDTEVWLKRYRRFLNFIGKEAYTFVDDAGHSVAATVKSVDTATGKLELTAAIGTALRKSDKAALIWPLGGLSGSPLWIGERSSLAILDNYIAHELGHTLAKWKDVCERNNLMHGGGVTGVKLRHRPISKYYSPAANEEQWAVMPRTRT
jgi:hypothetical protein